MNKEFWQGFWKVFRIRLEIIAFIFGLFVIVATIGALMLLLFFGEVSQIYLEAMLYMAAIIIFDLLVVFISVFVKTYKKKSE